MTKTTMKQNFFGKAINVLSHPAWNGVSCFFTALAALAALGLTGLALGFVFGVFRRIQDLLTWLSEPLNISRYVLVGGALVLIPLLATTAQQYFSSRHKFSVPSKRNGFVEDRPKFLPLSMPGMGNSYLKSRYIGLPSGDVIWGGAQFQLKPDSLIFDTGQHIGYFTPRKDGVKEIDCQLRESVNRVKTIHFLINSGNSKSIYADESIGEIRLIFKDAPPICVELILGQNIREWCPGHHGDFVRDASSPTLTKGAWTGLSIDGANAVIDCLHIPVFECMRNCFLERIIFVHKSLQRPPDEMGVHFSVFAVSLEIEQGA